MNAPVPMLDTAQVLSSVSQKISTLGISYLAIFVRRLWHLRLDFTVALSKSVLVRARIFLLFCLIGSLLQG